jgi:hypothetical protein
MCGIIGFIVWFRGEISICPTSRDKYTRWKGQIPFQTYPKTLGFHPKPDKLDAV